jgi:hypothetical protein
MSPLSGMGSLKHSLLALESLQELYARPPYHRAHPGNCYNHQEHDHAHHDDYNNWHSISINHNDISRIRRRAGEP